MINIYLKLFKIFNSILIIILSLTLSCIAISCFADVSEDNVYNRSIISNLNETVKKLNDDIEELNHASFYRVWNSSSDDSNINYSYTKKLTDENIDKKDVDVLAHNNDNLYYFVGWNNNDDNLNYHDANYATATSSKLDARWNSTLDAKDDNTTKNG